MTPNQPPATPPPNFDRVAHIYRWAEYLALGPLLQRTRTHFLPELLDRRQALVLGDGDGRFLAKLLSASPNITVTAADTSASMLRLLTSRCTPHTPRLQTTQSSALEITPTPDTDLIVTHFLLDCFTQSEVDVLAQRFGAPLPPGALWLLSDFGQPTRPWQRPFAAIYVRALYFAFRLTTGLRITHLPNPQQALSSAGFRLRRRNTRLGGLLYTELWELPTSPLHPGPPHRAATPSIQPAEAMTPTPQPDTEPYEPLPDPLPDPEPAAPSLREPDPGVFHHDPAAPTSPARPAESDCA
jgi:ubiquinone/menaquinone biosynthesis C-methylase UbiE